MQERPFHRHNIPAARDLRQRMTPTEEVLWSALRRKTRGQKWRRQHPVLPWVLDFYCPEVKLAIEVDGGVHDLAEQMQIDIARQGSLESMGVQFLRIRSSDVVSNLEGVLFLIDETVERLRGQGV